MNWFGDKPPKETENATIAEASGDVLYVAVLALEYGEEYRSRAGLQWAWVCDADEMRALGHALNHADPAAKVVQRLVIKVPLATGTTALEDDAEDISQLGGSDAK